MDTASSSRIFIFYFKGRALVHVSLNMHFICVLGLKWNHVHEGIKKRDIYTVNSFKIPDHCSLELRVLGTSL